ncbi:MAG: c-type cytochrome [Nitrospira sp.]|nr:c-type cytochrome [Nitrospira sp.]MBX3334562.1 c-type cytochrome [Nitrospira sp.]MDR4464863.1 c-type cytochrome [Nitrospira sp.]MDR4466964.1 c-type cytochrome [Nitrospira sp.]
MRRAQLGKVILTGMFILGTVAAIPAGAGEPLQLPTLQGLEDPNTFVPEDNPLTKEKVELGRMLFFDKRLSKNDTIACANCHMASKGFGDGMPVSTGIKGLKGGRSAPVSFNRVYSKAQFWDGRAATLEDQSIGPFVNPVEHGFVNHDEMVAKMKKIPGYRKLFKDVFGRDIEIGDVGRAIASFQRTVLSGNSAVDKFDIGGDEKALSDSAKRGLELFRGKARCTRCHSGFNFTDEKFHNLGIGWDTNTVDLGRYMETNNAEDIGAFKTPTLREIARTAPYMHDGRFKTLAEVVDFYNKGGVKNPHQDNTIIPLELTDEEKNDLVAMLKSLNGEGWQHVSAPKSFPK